MTGLTCTAHILVLDLCMYTKEKKKGMASLLTFGGGVTHFGRCHVADPPEPTVYLDHPIVHAEQ